MSQPALQPGGLEQLADELAGCNRLLALTGAGCSTASGIPDYRDASGAWKRKPPVQLREFLRSERSRRRYWARSMVGWPTVASAQPGTAHRCLAALEEQGPAHWLITQNVDGLHQRAGSRGVTDLHGRLDTVRCLECGTLLARDLYQQRLQQANPEWQSGTAGAAPDGDADLVGAEYNTFRVPDCSNCGGLLKPDVVFFGETVPTPVVEHGFRQVEEADAMLVVGSSLMVWSGYRFVRHAAALGVPVYIINQGRTRGEREARLQLHADCGQALTALLRLLGIAGPVDSMEAGLP
ncbi:MAG: NAD-dependent protein deacetylase [Ectothiorhodospiraceae bacterium]|nr:NAD-dependent protein deacetylase [Ectothiorhodospiraceae bacterium]MCH8503182.1 NAD-dependent protein deacetylase [Ectothiorhodospiraceae bacterium]